MSKLVKALLGKDLPGCTKTNQTPLILEDFPIQIHVDPIRMELYIFKFKGSHMEMYEGLEWGGGLVFTIH